MRRRIAIGAAALTVACNPGQPTATGQSDIPLLRTEGMQDFGDYVIHVNAITTADLPAAVADQHGIVRSGSIGLLTLNVQRKHPDGTTHAVQSEVKSSAANLTGQLKEMSLQEITEGDAIYYIGELDVADGETLTYTIHVTPSGEDEPLSLRYRRQFFTDE